LLRAQPEDEIAADVIASDADVITPDADVANGNEQASPAQQAIYVRAGKKPNRPCLFCGAMQSQLVRHLKRKHAQEESVIAAVKLPKIEQEKAFGDLRKMAIYKTNVELAKTDGAVLHRERRQGKDQTDLVMCSSCKGFYAKRRIWKHKKICYESCTQTGFVWFPKSRSASLGLLLSNSEVPDEFETQIVEKFRNDETGKVCRNDIVVLRLGRKLWAKSVRKEKHVIMNNMRTFGNLITEVRKVTNNNKIGGEDIIKRENFESLTKAIENMTTQGQTFKAGLKIAIGYLLKKVIKVMKGHYILENKMEKATELDRFLSVLDLNWDFIFYRAQLICEQRRQNLRKPQDMPLEEDLSKFKDFIVNKTREMTEDTYTKWDNHDFVLMRNLLVSRLTMFNARRGGEPARMTLSEWLEAENDTWLDQDLVQNISDPIEKELIKDLKLAYQAGKGSRKLVPVLFPKDTINPLLKLISERPACDVSESNPFLFPNTGSSQDHANGWNCIQAVAKLMGNELKKPNLLIADKFRHRASTLFALLEMPQHKRELFYRHMGHSETINKEVYQCPLALLEITEVGGFFDKLDKQDKQENRIFERSCSQRLQADNKVVPEIQFENFLDDNSCSNLIAHQSCNSEVLAYDDLDLPICEPEIITDSTRKPVKSAVKEHIRQYTRWIKEDSAKVELYFKAYIHDHSSHGAKGSLPSKKQIIDFLKVNTVFPQADLSERNKIKLIKTKIFNERLKERKKLHFQAV